MFDSLSYIKKYYKKIIEALLYVADLKQAKEKGLAKFIAALQKFLQALEEGIENRYLPIRLKFVVRGLQEKLPQLADPSLIDQPSRSNMLEEALKLLAQIIHSFMRSLIRNMRNGVVVSVRQRIVNAIHGQVNGNGGNDVVVDAAAAVQQFSNQVVGGLTDDIVNSLNRPKPSAPTFRSDVYSNEIDSLLNTISGLHAEMVHTLHDEILDLILSVGDDLYSAIDSVLWLYSRFSGNNDGDNYRNSFNEIFNSGDEFSDLVWRNHDELTNSFSLFTPETNPELTIRQQPTNPEKGKPDVPEWEEENTAKPEDLSNYVYL